MAVIWAIALAKLVFHIYCNNRYGYFRDEFDSMSCGDHLQWGYVDQPPLIPFLIHICRAVLGDSLRSIRFIPALASSLLVVQTAVLARELGGRRYAILLSAVCAAIVPQYLSNGSLLGTNCLEPNLWMGCAYFAILAIRQDNPRHWLWFGVCAGIGLENKYTIAIFCLGIVVGLLLTEQRRRLLSKWMWLGGLAAFLIFLPNLLWNIHYDWPFVQLMRAIPAEGRDVVWGPAQFFFQQVLISNPLVAPLWLGGLFALLFSAGRIGCWLGATWLPTPSCFCFTGKITIWPRFTRCCWQRERWRLNIGWIIRVWIILGWTILGRIILVWTVPKARRRACSGWKPTLVMVLVASGIHLMPIVVPVLSPEHFLTYTKTLPFKLPVNEYSHMRTSLPQWYADQFGWKEIAVEAEVAWSRVPADQRSDCAIFGQDYGQAGAIDFFGRAHGLPPALSGDRTYWLWGPHGYSGNCMIVLGDRKERLQQLFNQVEYVGTSADNPWALESQISVYICRGARFGMLEDLWPQLKRWR